MSLDSEIVLARINAILHVSDVDALIVQAFRERYDSVEQLDGALYGIAPVIVHPIVGLYQIVFNRTPDDEGLSYWIGRLTEDAIVPSSDTALRAITTEFAASDEWQALVKGKTNAEIVTALYQQALGRPPEQAGLDYWVGELDKGRAPTDLILDFARSPEFIARTTPHIEGFLRGNEPVDPADTSLFDVPPTDRTIDEPLPYEVVKDRIADILRFDASYHLVTTFADRYDSLDELDAALLDFAAVTITPVIGLYQAAFNRVPDGDGLDYWRSLLGEAGIGLFHPDVLKEIAARFADIDEWQDKFEGQSSREIVETIYRQALGREGDEPGILYWTGELDAGRSPGDLLVDFVLSDEFIGKAAPHFDTLLLSAARGDLPAEGPLFDVKPYTLVDGVLTLTIDGAYTLTADEDGGAVLRLLAANHVIPSETLDGVDTIVVPKDIAVHITGDVLGEREIAFIGDADGAGAIDITGVSVTEASESTPLVIVEPDLSGVSIGDGGPSVTINGGLKDWFVVHWAALDAAYRTIAAIDSNALFGDYENNTPLPEGVTILGETTVGEAALAVNTAFIELAASYADYLDNGGAPLTDFVAKATPTRSQLIHDNILGNGSDIAIDGRSFPEDIETALRNLLPDWVEGRPVVSGNAGDAFTLAHRQALAIDWEKGFDRPDYVNPIKLGTIDAIGIRDGNQTHVGSGNTPDNYVIERHEGAGVEVGLKVHYRQGDDILPEGSASDDGIVTFKVPTGHQQEDVGGAPVTNINRAAWSFDFSVLTGINGQDTTLDDFLFTIQIDVDPSAATNFIVLELNQVGLDGNRPWFEAGADQSEDPFIPDEVVGTTPENDAFISQNSLNFGFNHIRTRIDTDAEIYDFGPGQFDIIISAATRGDDSVPLARTHIVVNVVDEEEITTVGTPEAAVFALPDFV